MLKRSAISLQGALVLAACNTLAGLGDLRFDAATGTAGAGGGAGAGGAAGGGGTGGGGTGGDGGAAGSPPLLCGGVGVLTDDFEDGTPVPRWLAQDSGNVAVSETNGVVRMQVTPGGTAPHYGLYTTHRLFDLMGRAVSVEVPLISPNGVVSTSFNVLKDDDNELRFVESSDGLSAWWEVDTVDTMIASMSYDAEAHRWWRFREDGGMVHAEVSADGSAWNELGSGVPTDDLFPLDFVEVELATATGDGNASASVRFDNVNGGTAASEGWCPASSFSDDFDDDLRAPEWGRSQGAFGSTGVEMGGELVLTLTANVGATYRYESGHAYDLSGGAISVELTGPPPPNDVRATFYVQRGASDTLGFAVDDGYLMAVYTIGGSATTLESAPFDATAHRWWRLSEQDGVYLWQTAPDGRVWSDFWSARVAFDATALSVRMGAYSDQSAGSEVRFDNYNVLPP